MNIQELEKRIKLPEAAGKAVDQIKITEAEYQEQKQIFDKETTACKYFKNEKEAVFTLLQIVILLCFVYMHPLLWQLLFQLPSLR